MQRKMELIYRILGYIAEQDTYGLIEFPSFPDYSAGEIEYHILLCEDAGFIETCKDGGGRKRIKRLTWAGHQAFEEKE